MVEVGFRIMSMALTSQPAEDMLFMMTENNQLIKCNIALDGSEEASKFEYVIFNFHETHITGMDVCIRKQLLVTCSTDKTVRIWNYATKQLEITHSINDEPLSVAFHPSGFHIVLGTQDKINWMNVLTKSISSGGLKSVQTKHCKEIKFANGGHLFAAVHTNSIQVFNFYTGEQFKHPFKGHLNKPRCIDWFEDDSGFISCGNDGAIYVFDVLTSTENNRDLELDYNIKGIQFSSVVKIPGPGKNLYAVGSDGTIKEIDKTKEKQKLDTGTVLSQIVLTSNQKALFAGTGEEGKPGAVVIFKLPFMKINEIQGHSKPIERMRLSYDNNYLFTAGKDGCLILYDVKDRDPRSGKREREAMALPFSDEILTEKSE